MYPLSDIDMYSTDADTSTFCGLDCLLDISMDQQKSDRLMPICWQ
jgi:hypothetical protein